ncbi:MAG: Ig-like domain-containing protein [Prevotella sp.]|nr:Ig-like domain-containing protein [Prevotella sp.]
MKKIRLLSIVWLLSATAFAADYTGIQLTFLRTGTDANSVTVTVSDQNGNALSGVTASLESTSFGTLMTGSAQALTNGSVLAPANNSSYASINGTVNAEITYLFRINGLAPSFYYNKADIDVYAMKADGTAQGNGGGTKRYFQFSVSTGSTSTVSLFAEKTEATDICTVTDQTGGLYHSVQTMTASSQQMASTPLYVRVTLTKTSEQGCYAGIGSVKLYADPAPSAYHEFSGSKYYTIHKFGNNNTYMHDLGSEIGTSAKSSQNKCWWLLIPTTNDDCYYIMNAASGKYIQSPKDLLQNVPVAMGDTPVEFQIKKDETTGATTNGYYYIASTDQTISYVGDVTKGLNYSSANSRVVSWWIKTGRVNSYWEIVEEENGYTPPAGPSSFTRSAQIYSIPCGEKGSAYLSKADFEGADVLSELHFSATAKPASHAFLYTEQKASVKQGGTLPVSITVAGGSARTFAYTDWNKDGAFEASQEITGGTVNLAVPTDAKLGQYRVRIRVLNGVADAEAQATGFSYDFFVNVVSSEAEIEWSVKPSNAMRGTTSGEVVTKNNKKYLKVSVKPIGDAVFKGWKLMNNYFQGTSIYTPADATDLEHEFELTQNLHLVAELEPNTKVEQVVSNAAYSTMYYSNVALKVPANVEASTYKVENGVLSKSKTYVTNDIIPAGEPVVIFDNDRNDANTYEFRIATTKASPDPDNMLLGFDEAQTTVGPDPSQSYKFYKFSFKGRDSEGKPTNVGFYYGASGGAAFISDAHKAYLAVPTSAMGSAKEFLSMQDGDVNGIEDIRTDAADASVYTVQGVKVMENADNHSKLPKGIYIINQRKVIIK